MALQKARFSEIPKDAIILDERQALKYHFNVIKNWDKPSEVFFIKYGGFILGGAGFFTGLFINSIFRSKLHLYNYGRMSTYLPTCLIPAMFATAMHYEFIIPDLMLMKTECPVCVEMRSSAVQAAIGFAFPMIMSPVSCLSIAQRYMTYDVPYVTQKPLEVLNMLRKMIKPHQNLLFAIFVGHALLGSAITYLEAKSIFTVNKELLRIEESVESTHFQINK